MGVRSPPVASTVWVTIDLTREVHAMDDWQGIVAQFGPLVWKTAYRLLTHQTDAADCFQETFLSALEVARRQKVRHWPGLLQRLATARALDALRKRVRQGRQLASVDADLLPGCYPDPQQQAQAAEMAEQLRQSLAQLPARQAEIFCLREISGLTYEAIAAETGMSSDAVGVTLHRARAQLRDLLKSTYPDECNRR